MLYDVSIRIVHRYDHPVTAARHLLRLTPATLPSEQTCLASTLDIAPPPFERRARIDFFGAHTVEAAFDDTHAHIDFALTARVRREAKDAALDLSPAIGELRREIDACATLDADAPHHFTPPSQRAPLVDAVTRFARNVAAPGMTAVECVTALGRAVHDHIVFDPDATTVDTPLADAFAARRGVCQDISHVMIAGLRGLGVPAGYVSGYVRTRPAHGQPHLEGADAMHAWVRAWCGVETGWIDYDPTNAMVVSDEHIVVAHGRDYADVAPVKGVLRTTGAQSSDHAVDVRVVAE